MEEDQKPFPTMLFVNEAFRHTKALETPEIKVEIKQEDDQSSDFCSQKATCVKTEECEFDDGVSSHSNQDVVLLKIEKKEEENNVDYDSTWIKSESKIQVDTDSDVSVDDDNIEIKIERQEESSILSHDSNQIKPERRIQVDTDSLRSNDYCHTKVENDISGGFCLPMKSEIGENQATSPDCYEIKVERDDEQDYNSFTDTCPTTNTDSSLITSPDMPTNIQEYSKAGTVCMASMMDRTTERVENHSEIRMLSTSTLNTNKRISSEMDELNRTMRIQPGDEPETFFYYTCTVCTKTFTDKSGLKLHMRHHIGEKPNQGTVCGDRNSSITKDMKSLGEKPYKCTICDKAFAQNSTLSRHFRIHTGDKPFKCTMCDKAFAQSCQRTIHMRLHTGEKPFKCTVCGKAFTHCSHLTTHMRLHTGEKPFKCTVCDKAFTHCSHLTTHMRCHTGDKPYICSVCDKAFIQNIHLSRHMRIHTGDRPFKCTVCEKAFNRNDYLANHMRLHTGEKSVADPQPLTAGLEING